MSFFIAGGNPGYRANLAVFPDDDLVIAHLANVQVTQLPSYLPFYVADGILGLPKTEDWIHEYTVKKTKYVYDLYTKMGDGDLPVRIEGKPCSHALADYTGEYTHPVYGKVSVTLDGSGNVLLWEMRTFNGKLDHYHYESFKGFAHDFGTKGNILLTFQTSNKGSVDSVGITLFFGAPYEVFQRSDIPKL